jgi:tellurite methyltransferase
LATRCNYNIFIRRQPKKVKFMFEPAGLLKEHLPWIEGGSLPGPILDLASGECHNGIFLAQRGLPVICCDRSRQALERAKALAAARGTVVETWQQDLELEGANPLPEDSYGGILVFRYLHRPIISCIRKALRKRGILLYETFTLDQSKFGEPHNPNFLLKPGELHRWFEDWEITHYFEGLLERPRRAIAQIVCRRPE